MTLRRYNPRRDKNEPEIIRVLEQCGFAVSRCSGAGLPDLILSRRGFWALAEVKAPGGRDRRSQIDFRQQHKASVARLTCTEDAVRFSEVFPLASV